MVIDAQRMSIRNVSRCLLDGSPENPMIRLANGDEGEGHQSIDFFDWLHMVRKRISFFPFFFPFHSNGCP